MSKQVELDRACNDCWAQGVKHERKRIIALLETAMCESAICSGVCWSCQIRSEQIALIKGENQ